MGSERRAGSRSESLWIDDAPDPIHQLDLHLGRLDFPLRRLKTTDGQAQVFEAHTPIGRVRVLQAGRRRRTRKVLLAPRGSDHFVDADGWERCTTGRRLPTTPALTDQVAWIVGLLDIGEVPEVDPACWKEHAQDDDSESPRPDRRRTERTAGLFNSGPELTHTLTLGDVPVPVAELDTHLRRHGSPLRSVATTSGRGRILQADTAVGTVRVWQAETDHRTWGVSLAPTGSSTFVDADVWRSCREDEFIQLDPPTLEEGCAWVAESIDAGALPHVDEACLARRAAYRAQQPRAVSGAAFLAVIVLGFGTVFAASWYGMSRDLPGVGVGAAVLFNTVVLALLRPYAVRFRQKRDERRATRPNRRNNVDEHSD